MQPNVGLDGKIPVFVFPNSISFYLEDQRSYKQILTLYNPYDFPIKFNVLCTAPKKFAVVDPTGSIRPRCCVDLVVRHTCPTLSNCHAQDKLRVQVQELGNKKTIGKRDVLAVLYPGYPKSTSDEGSASAEAEEFKQLTSGASTTAASSSQYGLVRDRPVRPHGSINYVVTAVAVACLVALLLPTEGDKNSKLPNYLHLSIQVKLMCAYALGLVTMVILRQA